MVTNYVSFHLDKLPGFGGIPTCKYRGMDVQCGPRGLPGDGDALFYNNGDGTFTDVSKSAGVDDPNRYYRLGVTWVDFNNTGRQDIFVNNDATPNYLYKNEGNGKFTEIGLESGTAVSQDGAEQACMGLAIGDYLHNGYPSVFITNFADEHDTLYRNNGSWNFDDVSYKSGEALPSPLSSGEMPSSILTTTGGSICWWSLAMRIPKPRVRLPRLAMLNRNCCN